MLGLDGVAQEVAAASRARPEGGGELGDRELRDRRGTGAGDLEVAFLPRLVGVDPVTGVQGGPVGGDLEAPCLEGIEVGLDGARGTEDLVAGPVLGASCAVVVMTPLDQGPPTVRSAQNPHIHRVLGTSESKVSRRARWGGSAGGIPGLQRRPQHVDHEPTVSRAPAVTTLG